MTTTQQLLEEVLAGGDTTTVKREIGMYGAILKYNSLGGRTEIIFSKSMRNKPASLLIKSDGGFRLTLNRHYWHNFDDKSKSQVIKTVVAHMIGSDIDGSTGRNDQWKSLVRHIDGHTRTFIPVRKQK